MCKYVLFRLEQPCQEEELCDPLGVVIRSHLSISTSGQQIWNESGYSIKHLIILIILSGTVCLGPISPLHLAFQVWWEKNTIKCIIILSSQYQLDPDSLPEHTRPGPSIAAVTRVNLIIIITTIPTITSSQIYKNDGNPLKGWKPFLHFSSARSCQRRLHPRCSSGYLHHLCNHLYHDHDHYNRYHRHCHK